MYFRAIAIWFLLLLLAIANGGLREAFFIPATGRTTGLAVSTLLLSALIFLVVYGTIRWIGPRGPSEAWRVGAGWLAATLGFEFGFGHFLRGLSWRELLADYDLSAGRIWPLVLLTTLLSPVVVARLRRIY